MPTIPIKASEFERAIAKHLGLVVDDLSALTFEVAHRGVAEATRITNAEKIVDKGAYKRGFHVTDTARTRQDGLRDMRFKRRGTAILANNVPHAIYVEFGRRPGKPPPFEAIRQWARRKFGIKATGKGIRGQSRKDFELINAIRWKIAHNGIKPRHVMFRVYRQMEKWYHEGFPAVLRKR